MGEKNVIKGSCIKMTSSFFFKYADTIQKEDEMGFFNMEPKVWTLPPTIRKETD